MADQLMDWRGEPFRLKVVAQIEEVVRSSAPHITKSSSEMEMHVFQKAKTREEYLALVARLILHMKEMTLTPMEVLLFPAMKPDITKKSGEETDKQPPTTPGS